MAFRDFTYPEVLERLGLSDRYERLFPEPPPVSPRPHVAETLAFMTERYGATTNQKARSEFLIAPMLTELQFRYPNQFRVFSGVELSADPEKGLNGVCDFAFARGENPYALTDPIIAVAEARPDAVATGFGQCIAGMRAAWLVNDKKGRRVPVVYGVSTTGMQWKFLRLADTVVTIDQAEYSITEPERVLGVLSHIIELTTA